jgi:hypothetical protein
MYSVRHLVGLLALLGIPAQMPAITPMPMQYTVEIAVRGNGQEFVLHALTAAAAKINIACSAEPQSATLQCRSGGKIVMTALGGAIVAIWVYVDPPPGIKSALYEVISAAKLTDDVTRIEARGLEPSGVLFERH